MWYWQVNVMASLVQAWQLQAEITAVVESFTYFFLNKKKTTDNS